jgi:hypothetical protein
VSADEAEDRANVEARRATDALQRLLEAGVVRHLVAPVVHQDDVQLFRRSVGVGHGAANDGNITGKQLPGSTLGQGRENGRDVLKVLDQFFQPDNRHVNARQGSHQPRIALIGDDDDAAGLGYSNVCAGDAHIGVEKHRAQLAAGELHQRGDVGLLTRLDILAENLGNILLGHVNGGHDHVGGPLVGKLNDPLAQVGLLHRNAGLFQMLVEMNLLRGHGLRLDDALDAALPREAENIVVYGLGIAGAENLGAAGLGDARKLLGQFVEVRCGGRLDLGYLGAHRFEVNAFISIGAANSIGLGESA